MNIPPDGKTDYIFRLSPDDHWFTHAGQNPNFKPLDIPSYIGLKCSLSKQADMDDPRFMYWNYKYKWGMWYHSKQWEMGYILQALFEAGMLKRGFSGVGFGIGKELLPSILVDQGCKVLCTDQAQEKAGAWDTTGQFGGALDAIYYPNCSKENWKMRASYRTVDMNRIPPDLGKFDFSWSMCALEHLGSLQHGLDFILNTLKHLKPGGIAVHTTAYNIESNDATIEAGPTCWYRKRDIEALYAAVKYRCFDMAPLDLTPGNLPLDRLIDKQPYHISPVMNLMVEQYVTGCVGTIIVNRDPC